jgi:RNA polymerase subunit RPABC4/transcription elongation factor Spt4
VTLPPWSGPQVRGVPGPEYKVGPLCCNPGCHHYAEHAHHIFRRTDPRLGGAFDWVEIKGAVYQNKTAICPRCHDDVTGRIGGHRAAIKLLGDDYDWVWWWCAVKHTEDEVELSQPLAPIEPQPMTPEAFANSRVLPSESEACPTCGHVKRARPSLAGRGRARKSWTIKVPDDAEDGAEILDTLVDDMGVILGIEPTQVGRYYIVLPCVYYAHQEKPRFVESLKGVGG